MIFPKTLFRVCLNFINRSTNINLSFILHEISSRIARLLVLKFHSSKQKMDSFRLKEQILNTLLK